VYPFVLYHSAELGFNFENESIQGISTLWLGFKEDITVGSVFNLHCRQCHISQVCLHDSSSFCSPGPSFEDLLLRLCTPSPHPTTHERFTSMAKSVISCTTIH
jgi:hypothetical protein